MRVIGTSSQILIARPPGDVFRFVTTPDNWVGSHPVTASVRGETSQPRGAGTRWVEVIQPNPQAPGFETEWWATIAVPDRLWAIETKRLAFDGLRCRIVYTFSAEAGGTRFHRDMACLVSDELRLDPAMEAALAMPDPHDAYLARLKQKLEQAGPR
jgi:hypothetical protein